jgi:hypothetical protein
LAARRQDRVRIVAAAVRAGLTDHVAVERRPRRIEVSVNAKNTSSVLVTEDDDVLVITDASTEHLPPNVYAVAIAFVATLVVAAALGTIGGWTSGGLGLALMTAVVAITAWWCRPLPSLLTGAFGWLMFNGFVADQFGALRWHGSIDAVRLGVLVGAAVVASLLRAVVMAMNRRVVIEEISTLRPVIPRPRAARLPRTQTRRTLPQGGTHA